jgi:nucleoside-diphosphate-sugar epimerase
MRILLTGHEGYLGSRLTSYLRERGHAVIGLGRREDITTLTRATLDREQIELVLHAAAAANRIDAGYVLDSADERVNVQGTRALVQALHGTEIGLIHISTKDVYGEVYTTADVREDKLRLVPRFTVRESQPFHPATLYAKTKLVAEFIAESHPKTTILRLSTGYTSEPHPRGNWILHFCRAARRGAPIQLHGSGRQLRDPVHADDLGALALLVAERAAWGHTLNVGGGMAGAWSILEVVEMIDPHLARSFSGAGDLGYVSNLSLAQKLTGWQPVLSFPDELRKLMEKVGRE